VARFTLDSATSFLFGTCVHSLRAGLPYPSTSLQVQDGTVIPPHPAEAFARSLLQAQHLAAERERRRFIWPLYEMFKDKSAEPMKVVNAFLEPIIEGAVQRQLKTRSNANRLPDQEKSDDDEEETMLGSLLTMTKGGDTVSSLHLQLPKGAQPR
jgi:hypothetical protein